MTQATQTLVERIEILKASSAVIEFRFANKKPIGVFAEKNGASLVDRFLSGYVTSLHSNINVEKRPTFGQCVNLLESIEGKSKEFNLGSPSIIHRTYDFIVVPELSAVLYQSEMSDGLNPLSNIYLREILPFKLKYHLDGSFTNLRQAERVESPRLDWLLRVDERGYVRNP